MHTLSLLLVLLTLCTVSLSSPLTHRKSRVKRSYGSDTDLAVDVVTEWVDLKAAMSASFRCRAKGGVDVERQPYVSFYRQLGPYTHMPLSSGDPGIEVQPSAPSDEDLMDFYGFQDDDVIKSVKVLNIGPAIYETLTDGQNDFYCKVSTLSGETATSHFVVNKIPPKYNRRRRPYPFRRRTHG